MVQETGVPGENHRPVVSQWQTLSHNGVLMSSTARHELTTINMQFDILKNTELDILISCVSMFYSCLISLISYQLLYSIHCFEYKITEGLLNM